MSKSIPLLVAIAILSSCAMNGGSGKVNGGNGKVNPDDVKPYIGPQSYGTVFQHFTQHTAIEVNNIKVSQPASSRDGSFFVYASQEVSQNFQLMCRGAEAGVSRQLTSDSSNHLFPSVSPDGKFVAFASDKAGNWDIYILDIDNPNAVREITFNSQDEVAPSWSPDGKQLCYMLRTPQGYWQITVINIHTRVTSYLGPGMFPKWSPAEDLIVFQSLRGDARRQSIWLIRTDGSDVRELDVDKSGKYSAVCPAFTSDGKWVVYAEARDDKPSYYIADDFGVDKLFMIRVDGTDKTEISNGMNPQWWPSGGGKKVYFVSVRNGFQNIFSIEPRVIDMKMDGGTSNEKSTGEQNVVATEK